MWGEVFVFLFYVGVALAIKSLHNQAKLQFWACHISRNIKCENDSINSFNAMLIKSRNYYKREKGKLNKSTGNDSANKEPKLLHEREVGNFNKPIPTQICR